MNTIDPHDPFRRLKKPTPTPASTDQYHPQPDETAQPAQKTRRPYARRAPASSAKQAAADGPLVLAHVSTGALNIQQGQNLMELTAGQRVQLEMFLASVAPKGASQPTTARQRRRCTHCQERRSVAKFEGDSNVCKDCQ